MERDLYENIGSQTPSGSERELKTRVSAGTSLHSLELADKKGPVTHIHQRA